jgi:hypothetical protein
MPLAPVVAGVDSDEDIDARAELNRAALTEIVGPGRAVSFVAGAEVFPAGLDNSGFVGWLAGRLKTELGTGVFVICGSNRDRGGIYDYWGCPIGLLDDTVAVVEALRAG